MALPRVEYDRDADAAYIYLVEDILGGAVDRTVSVTPSDIGGVVNLDLDSDGLILGIEVMDASRLLSPALLG
jgi:uncharacterized protein YuzE